MIVYIVTAIVFCRWIIKAHRKVIELGAEGMTISPGWAVGYFFIPFINLVRPYRAMKELWKASINPKEWITQEVPRLLPWWWTLWITVGILGQASLRLSMDAHTIESLKTVTIADLIEAPIGIILNLVALRLVTLIAKNIHKNEAAN